MEMEIDIAVPSTVQLTRRQHSQRLRRDRERRGHITDSQDDTPAGLRRLNVIILGHVMTYVLIAGLCAGRPND